MRLSSKLLTNLEIVRQRLARIWVPQPVNLPLLQPFPIFWDKARMPSPPLVIIKTIWSLLYIRSNQNPRQACKADERILISYKVKQLRDMAMSNTQPQWLRACRTDSKIGSILGIPSLPLCKTASKLKILQPKHLSRIEALPKPKSRVVLH